jgi:hypothetical protein
LAFFAEASSNASGDGPHRALQRGAKAAERSLVGGLTNDDMMPPQGPIEHYSV